jgi:hypothetical protein
MTLGRDTLPVTFRDRSNYPTEMITFEVVDFSGPYNIPSYVYLKLKIPRPAGVITVEAKAQ